MSKALLVPLTDAIIVAISQLVDDAQTERRDPSHADIKFAFERYSLSHGDPAFHGQSVGKAKRVKSTLSWAIEHAPEPGAQFVVAFISTVRGYGAFRETSPNYVGEHTYENTAMAFGVEGVDLSSRGEPLPRLV